jgi:hypothetical protein
LSELAAVIGREEAIRRKHVWACAGICLLLSFLAAYVAVARAIIHPDSVASIVAFGMAFALVIPMIVAAVASFPRKTLREAIRRFARLSDASNIDVLWRLSSSLTDRETSRQNMRALTKALRTAKASDAPSITRATRLGFERTLSVIPGANIRNQVKLDYYEALIRSMEQIGDASVLKPVERIAAIKGRSQDVAKLRQAAVDVLPALRERVRARKEPDMLLRPSTDESEMPLLIPAAGSAAEDPQVLLRARESAESERTQP